MLRMAMKAVSIKAISEFLISALTDVLAKCYNIVNFSLLKMLLGNDCNYSVKYTKTQIKCWTIEILLFN